MGKVGWSDLHEDLIDLLANNLSSNINLLRFRSICKPWRSTIATKKRLHNHFERNLPTFKKKKTVVFPSTFFRVTLPSPCPNKGWLIKNRQVSESSKNNLLSPLSGKPITPSDKTLDLLKLGVSEIRQSYNVQYLTKITKRVSGRDVIVGYKSSANSARVVFLNNMFFVVDFKNEIWCCKSGEESRRWTRINNEEAKGFLDIILHKGKVYALDLTGAIWWISLSELSIYQFGPSTPLDYYDIDNCKEKRFVEYRGDLCVLHRFCKKFRVNRVLIERTVGFKVYKMDKNLVKWVEVSSLGDKALIVATDSCFLVLASEYYGCLENAIYFNDGEDVSVFKLDDGSIINKQIDSSSSSSHESCFQMFSAPFL
ncbi:hypothetical protein ISN45_Aa01g029930 [Arabidopsis thaliana x Arabidopsis arenosa]|uniref:KIB1-4 beta-propeller domain-containing protein n=1 Tax=Arabidopsis thaliana x Arabidopsis arenosa TaxID=1240361 RepID=A0A8T2CB56_9BRAS|nr:hypothetical protein ISN45_Aa01g029930 [Arabidopsis thaliana x Arabidopsis arenosa]